MGIEHRPYVGTWQMEGRKLVQHTPDALVYINGDLTIPGCPKCNGRIDIQKFVTEVSVDGGTEPGAASASFTMSVPFATNESLFRDARALIRPGLEVTVYERGYFPVKGLYSNLGDPRNLENPPEGGGFDASGQVLVEQATLDEDMIAKWKGRGMDALDQGGSVGESAVYSAAAMEVVEQYWRQKYPAGRVEVRSSYRGGEESNHGTGAATDYVVKTGQGGAEVPPAEVWAGQKKLAADGKIPDGGHGMYVNPKTGRRTSTNHYDYRGSYGFKEGEPSMSWMRIDTNGDGKADMSTERSWGGGTGGAIGWLNTNGMGEQADYFNGAWGSDSGLPGTDGIPSLDQVMSTATEQVDGTMGPPAPVTPTSADFEPSLLEELGLAGQGLEDVLAYPYYHVFHGVVTQVGTARSGPTKTISVQCASMLHFWQYQRVSTNASLFGARPQNSKLKVSLVGHNFTGMHPYEIIYTLHNDVGGAAAGVSWALSQSTNQDASGITGDSLFSLNLKYWEQRFQNRQVKLRLHGASGELFNAAQADWLSRTKSSELTGLMKHRFNPTGGSANKGVMQQSEALGLRSSGLLDALQFSRRSAPGGVDGTYPRFEMNLGEMQAFTADIGNYGQVQLFESTYESKHDIAVAVCEITGFEFFQDVDGDFVFKPPMYNLDTSSSRVYRIEDIDIISINFDEKEPEFTYVTGKGPGFKNTLGTGLEGEWGVQGQYIDYRLVAQFGWRPLDFEVAYFNDSKSLFFASVNRMDIANAAINSASVTIPLRPELRPGYPVFIPYLDCFYYCNSFAHSFSVGGQCTTALQLIGKRAKFYAPGYPNKTGIEAIDLSNTYLPQKPLEVLDGNNSPRLSGFPNVVMALDPTQINPLFFVVGEDIDDIANDFTLQALLNMAVKVGALNTDDPSNPGPKYWIKVDATRNKYFWFEGPSGYAASATSTSKPDGAIDLKAAAEGYEAAQKKITKAVDTKVGEKAPLDYALTLKRAEQRSLNVDDPDDKKKKAALKRQKALKKEITAIETKLKKIDVAYDQAARAYGDKIGDSTKTGVDDLLKLVRSVGKGYLTDPQFGGQSMGDSTSTTNLLDMLGDKKAVFTNGQLPGSYRYYSASHPDPQHQGQMEPSFHVKKAQDEQALKFKAAYLESIWQGEEVTGYVDPPQARAGTKQPEAEFGIVRPTRGIRVLTNNPVAPQGEVVPTSEVRELMFATHDVAHVRKATSTKKRAERFEWTNTMQTALQNQATNNKDSQTTRTTVGDVFTDWFNATIRDSWVPTSTEAAQAELYDAVPGSETAPNFPTLIAPESITILGSAIDVDEVIDDHQFSGAGDQEGTALYPGAPKDSLDTFWNKAAKAYGTAIWGLLVVARGQWENDMEAQGFSIEDRLTVLTAFTTAFNSKIGAKSPPTPKKKGSPKALPGSLRKMMQSPVFPVSDASGYEVIGSYRYGRDLDIAPDGAWAALAEQDPLQFLSSAMVAQVVDVLVKGKKLYEDDVTILKDGTKKVVRKEIGGSTAATEVERRVLAQLRAQLTDEQILDLGFAIKTGDPNVLQLNMANFLASKAKDGVMKLPVQNAALSLADLNLQVGQNVCGCRMASADVLLAAAGQEQFVQFIEPGVMVPQGYGDGTQDKATQWLISTAAQSSVDWQLSQDALRGVLPDRSPVSLLETIQNLGDQFAEGQANVDRAVEDVKTAASAVKQAGLDVGEHAKDAFYDSWREGDTPEQFNAEVEEIRKQQAAKAAQPGGADEERER